MKEIEKISDILSENVFGKNTSPVSFSIKKAVAFSFWKDICGARFANFSFPYNIKGQTLFVTVKNPQVMQELIFNKAMIIAKLKNYFLPLNIKIEEIRYDYKNYGRLTSNIYLEGDETSYDIQDEELEEVRLNTREKEEFSRVTDTISSLSFLSEDLRERYLKNIINSFKAKKIRKGV